MCQMRFYCREKVKECFAHSTRTASTDSTVLHGTVYATWRIVCNLLMTLMKHLPWWSPVCVAEISS